MDTMIAFAMGMANRGRETMVFDWDKAAKIISERGAISASAGLEGDWDWTGGEILSGGQPFTESYCYLESTWATPQLEIDGEVIDCYRMSSESPGWHSSTLWPESALAILNAKETK